MNTIWGKEKQAQELLQRAVLLEKMDWLCEKLSLSKSAITRGIVKGTIPKPQKLGRNVRWNVHEIEAWLLLGSPSAEPWTRLKQSLLNSGS